MSLDQLQQRLDRHFEALRQQRTAAVGPQPIFALEHGLSAEELATLERDVRGFILTSPPRKDHAWPWVVYAAEVGYGYAGEEYWQTFEATTPGWRDHGTRLWLRRRFEEFRERFDGAMPSGRWAKWFSNICWPITHAILPKDLQHQLAQVLYESRHAFTQPILESPLAMGKLIAAYSWSANARFQKFVEQPLLVGQIATALLLHDQPDARGLILPSTLKRIADDLERIRQARAWLHDAQRHATRTRFQGLTTDRRDAQRAAAGEHPEPPSSEAQDYEIETLGIEPRLVLQPCGPDVYDVLLEIPNLSPLLHRFPDLADILPTTRCIVAGAAAGPLWRGRVLRDGQFVRLATWPASDEPLFRFERSHRILDYLLRTEALRRPGTRWLFRLAGDKLAYEMRGLRVRAGARYILLQSEADSTALPADLLRVELRCQGVRAVGLDIPDPLSPEWVKRCGLLGLHQTRALRVWPVGLPPASWDGEGHVEWLASDAACLACRADHALEELTVLVDNDEWSRVQFPATAPGKVHLLALPPLPVGAHRVTFRPRASDGYRSPEAADLRVIIREAQEWTPGVSSQGAFMVFVDPIRPTLEQFWEGDVAIEIHGPAGHPLSCRVALRARGADEALVCVDLPPLTLPVTAAQWQTQFGRHVRDNDAVNLHYDLAYALDIDWSAEEFGRFTLQCGRAFDPVRWALRRGQAGYELRVVNDSGEDAPLRLHRYDVAQPTVPVVLEDTGGVLAVPERGGLFTAAAGAFSRSILVPPFIIRSLQDLGANPTIDVADRSAHHLLSLLSLADMWATTRFAGSDLLASIRRRYDVVDALVRAVVVALAGEYWGHEEQVFRGRTDPGAAARLCQAVTRKPNERALAVVLERDRAQFVALSTAERVARLSALAEKFLDLPEPQSLAEYALRVASASPCSWPAMRQRTAIEQLRQHPTLLRAARAMVLTVAAAVTQGACEVGPVYGGWRWE